MPGINLKGTPDTNDYLLGRGIIYLSSLDANGKPTGGYRDIGNSPNFALSLEVETLDHFSSRAGLKVIDKSVVVSQSGTCTFGFDELNFQNLAAFLSGETALHTNPANAAAIVDRTLHAAGAWSRGLWYDLVTGGTDQRLYDLDLAGGTLAVKSGATALTVDVDFLVDATMGRIFIINKDSGNLGNPAADALIYSYASAGTPVEAALIPEVRGLTKTSIVVALKFIADNAIVDDDKFELQIHKVTLRADGDLSLIGDEISIGTLTGKIEKNEAISTTSPSLTIRSLG